MKTLSGLDRLVADSFSELRGKRIALMAHAASIDRNLRHILDLCLASDIQVVKMFAPEHGFSAAAQDMQTVGHEQRQQIPIISLYGTTKASLYIKPADLADVDILLCDLQDVGSRYYTFANTIIYAFAACQHTNTRCLVIDRPNPINGLQVEGNLVLPGYQSFVGELAIGNRHGLTLGELVAHAARERSFDGLEVIRMANWRRSDFFSDTGLPWVMPSPNMPTEETALVYPGACLFEGTNLSEGRGTTRPFELVGAPYITDAQKFAALVSAQLNGAIARPAHFSPSFHKHAQQICGGLQIHITDRQKFKPLQAGVAVLWAARQFQGFEWRTETYEFVSDILAIDLLFGDDQPRIILERGGQVDDVMNFFAQSEAKWATQQQSMLFYI